MVMAQYTNTQYVAHEFVRQYYTILHKDPTQLHRFYTKESRLTHGVSPNAKSDEQPVCGQEAIYEKISQLNFKNCFTKIRSVDSHPTLAGGVVIQVNGELANSGMQYRKFMQTFVLAQQEPKKYHVVNDIFRYQDETFEDTENDETIDGTVESENGYQTYDGVQSNDLNDVPIDQEVPLITNNKPLIDEPTDDYAYSGYLQNDQEQEPKMNGDIASEEPEEVQNNETEAQYVEEEPDLPVEKPADVEVPVEPVPEPSITETAEPTQEEIKPIVNEPEEQVQPTEPEGPPKPVTWAALAKKNTASSVVVAPVATPQPKPAPKKSSPAPQKAPPKKREEPQPKKEQSEEPRRRNIAPDNHQIFIGNLPTSITEKDVRDHFGEFGNIIEIRLNAKNFGFIAFDGPDAPSKILTKAKVKMESIVIHGNTINIEVKRSGGAGRERTNERGGGGGFRRDRGSDKERRGGGDRGGDRSDFNKNKNNGQFNNNRSSGGGGKNSSFGSGQKSRNNDGGKFNDDNKGQREQKRGEFNKQNRR